MSTRFLFALSITASLVHVDAHPMGNFSVNHYCRISVAPERADLVYALDLAEIPTFELLQKWNLTATSPRKALEQSAARQMQEWARHLKVESNGKVLHPVYESSELVIGDGAGNMPVMRITAKLRVTGGSGHLNYEDTNYPERAGWKEVVVAGGEDRSKGLTVYPQDPTVSAPQVLKASAPWPASPPVIVAKAAEPEAVKAVPVAAPATDKHSGSVVRGDF